MHLQKKIKMNPIENIAALGLTLPEASTPGGNYVSVNVRGNLAFIAIQFPIRNGAFFSRDGWAKN